MGNQSDNSHGKEGEPLPFHQLLAAMGTGVSLQPGALIRPGATPRTELCPQKLELGQGLAKTGALCKMWAQVGLLGKEGFGAKSPEMPARLTSLPVPKGASGSALPAQAGCNPWERHRCPL